MGRWGQSDLASVKGRLKLLQRVGVIQHSDVAAIQGGRHFLRHA